jgi:hypothetical protein
VIDRVRVFGVRLGRLACEDPRLCLGPGLCQAAGRAGNDCLCRGPLRSTTATALA